MLDHHTKNDIDKVVLQILKDSKTFNLFPTQVDKIVTYSELIIRDDLDISQIHFDYIHNANDALLRAIGKVRGLLDRPEKMVYLDLSQSKERKNFVKLHEVGHHVLPWQKSLHDIIDDDDISLSPDTTEEFEAEANYFASTTLFQHDRFTEEVHKMKLELSSSIKLAKLFGASVHATLRRYVECSKNRCALLVLEGITPRGTVASCSLRDTFQSSIFAETFGELSIPKNLGFTWSFVKDYYFGRKFKNDGSITLTTQNGEADFTYHFFSNGFNAFVLLFPYNEN